MKTLLFLLTLIGFSAQAGGPYMVDDVTRSGVPSRWPFENGKWVVHWKADLGGLNRSINNSAAVEEWVKPIFEKWKSVTLPDPKKSGAFLTTVALEFVYDGTVNVNVTAENYDDFIFETLDPAQRPATVIIFDENGSLVERFCKEQGGSEEDCKNHRVKVAGLAAPLNRDSTTKLIQNGFAILNGSLVDGVSDDNNGEMPSNQFKSVILHELGHLLNLSHSQVNFELSEECDRFDCATGPAVGTMYPASLTHEQFSLHRDDKVAISHLYPTSTFQEGYCTAVGSLLDKNGKGVQGINVIAQNELDPVLDARSAISGIFYPPTTADGHYVLAGLMPKTNYEIHYEELTHAYDLGGGFMPLGPASPTGVGTGVIADASGNAGIRCENGGEVIHLPNFTMNLQVDLEGQKKQLEESLRTSATSEKKGWFCSLHPKASFSQTAFLWLLLPLLLFYKRGFLGCMGK